MTSNSGAESPKDELSHNATYDAEADDSFATAPDVWHDDVEDAEPQDESREIADDEEDELHEIDGELHEESRNIDDQNEPYHEDDSIDDNPEDDTLPSLDEELQAERDASDSSLFQGPSPQVGSCHAIWRSGATH